jgi:plastocyanin
MGRFMAITIGAITVAAAACSGAGYTAPSSHNNGGGGGGNLPNAVDVVDYQFTPDSLNVAAGTTVSWTWGGYATHNVTFADPNVANSGDMVSGSFQQTFDTAGVFAYHCTHHAGMTGKIVVH